MYPPPFYNTIPLAYNDSLSYYQNLLIFIEKLNQLTKELHDFETNIENIVDEKIQENLADVLSKIEEAKTQLEAEISRLKEEAELRFDNLETELEERFTELSVEVNNRIIELTQTINTQINELSMEMIGVKNMFDVYTEQTNQNISARFEQIQEMINDLIANYDGDRITVINPIYGTYTTLNAALDDMQKVSISNQGLTALEYRNLQLTAKEYRDMNITAFVYRYKGKYLFFDRIFLGAIYKKLAEIEERVNLKLTEIENIVNTNLFVYDPWTGERNSLYNIVLNLVDLHKKNALTAEEYDNLQITAEDYDAKQLSAEQYDFEAKSLLGVHKN